MNLPNYNQESSGELTDREKWVLSQVRSMSDDQRRLFYAVLRAKLLGSSDVVESIMESVK